MKPGEKVVCINSFKQEHTREQLEKDCPNFVVKGKHYTIRAIRDFDFVVSILLEEISNPPLYFKSVDAVVEPGFRIDRFRKLQENEVEALVEELEEVTV